MNNIVLLSSIQQLPVLIPKKNQSEWCNDPLTRCLVAAGYPAIRCWAADHWAVIHLASPTVVGTAESWAPPMALMQAPGAASTLLSTAEAAAAHSPAQAPRQLRVLAPRLMDC